MSYDNTAVPVAKSQEQIQTMLRKAGSQAVRFTSLPSAAILEFAFKSAAYRYTLTPRLSKNSWSKPQQALETAERQVWRVMYWYLKAKLEAIEQGLVTFQEEFLPQMLIQGQQGEVATVHRVMAERLAQGSVASPDDPFSGLRPALPAPQRDQA